ncbi:hypothetical protein DERP_009838 [Dermatophagoides pteronyssinus]|uniref:Uncharacterized protein n=1 Tax=Dermatophagoides pteronyssinus TaxID=6956 RepID=A0ABQ8IRN6_DERPT|nr:hypothetical protein DERP_009838 [Dermatophagoides pteronyssinus]
MWITNTVNDDGDDSDEGNDQMIDDGGGGRIMNQKDIYSICIKCVFFWEKTKQKIVPRKKSRDFRSKKKFLKTNEDHKQNALWINK